MTTSVTIASPYNATRGLVVEVMDGEEVVKTFKIAPRETAETLHIEDDTTVTIRQDSDTMPGAAEPRNK